MSLKKILFYLAVVLTIFMIYKFTYKEKVNYIALGDSLALGINSYGEVGYGYTDYLIDYLKQNQKNGFYTKKFSKSGQTIQDLYEDIENNKTIIEDGKTYSIKKMLRESDLVTLSIGFNDFKDGITLESNLDNLNDISKLKENTDKVFEKFEELLYEIKKYAKGDIIVIGYYNPFPYLSSYKNEIDELVDYTNKKYQQICGKNNVLFLKVSHLFDNKIEYLPNPFDIHPNVLGYDAIFNELKNLIKISNGY